MDTFAKRPSPERQEVFQQAASELDILDIIVEKDFWVSWLLKRLASNSKLSQYLIFKGGTSLSKAYGLIKRFSEDIDLTISRDAPFVQDGKNPMEEGISNNERERRIEALKQNAQRFVHELALPELSRDIREHLGNSEAWDLKPAEDDNDNQTLLFEYPRIFNYSGRYNQPNVRLEFGARGEIEPHVIRMLKPLAAEKLPGLFPEPAFSVATLSAERTFWEKATILHALCHGAKVRGGLSRHCYDIHMMGKAGVATAAFRDLPLLEQVVRNKSIMFKDSKASYGTAKIGTLRLTPEKELREKLEEDYKAMQVMFMEIPPGFDEIITDLDKLEKEINKLNG